MRLLLIILIFFRLIHSKEEEEVIDITGSSSYPNHHLQLTISKIELHNFWQSLYSEQEVCILLKEYFGYLLQDISVNVKKIEIHSVFNNTVLNQDERKSDILYVHFSGESYYLSPNLFDISLIPALYSNNPVVIPHTLGGLHLYLHDLWDRLYATRNYITKTTSVSKFACFIVSNPGPTERISFFNHLNTVYKHVDSCGQYANNIGYLPPPCDTEDYYDFLSQYKFMICFENKQQDYYFTEKLINAYVGQTIPIYWGPTQLPEFINLKAIIYIPTTSQDDFSIAIQRIIELDNDDEKYKEVFQQPLFIGSLPSIIDKDVIRNKINDAYKFRNNP